MTRRPTVPPDQLIRAAVDKLWASLLARHSGANRARYGAVMITKDQFRDWLLSKSIDGKGLAWRCEDSGNVITYAAKTMAARMTLDHRVPLANGGTSTFDNFAIVSQEMNLIKGDLAFGFYARLLAFLKTWPEDQRESVLRRLKGYRPSWRTRKS